MTVMPASADSFVLIWRLDMTIASGIFCISIAAGVSTTGARGFRSLVIAAGSKWSGWMSVTRMRSAGLAFERSAKFVTGSTMTTVPLRSN